MSRIVLILLIINFLSTVYCNNIPEKIDQDPENTEQKPVKSDDKSVGFNIDVSKQASDSKNDQSNKINIPKPMDSSKSNHKNQHVEESHNGVKSASVNTNSSVSNNTTSSNEFRSHKKFNHNITEMDSNTLRRLILVLVAFSILFIIYLAFKTYRKQNRKHLMVSKYGVRTRRSDMEMRPLPLDEDEEDETVFDVGNVHAR